MDAPGGTRYPEPMPFRLPIPTPHLERTLTTAVVALVTLLALTKPVGAVDLALYLRMGAWIAEHRALPPTGLWSLAGASVPLQDVTWLAQVVLWGAWRLGGEPALPGILAVLVAITLATVAARAHRHAGPRWEAPATLLAALLLVGNLGVRPHAFSLPLFGIAAWILDCRLHARWAPAALLGLAALWANLHGAFPVAWILPAAGWLQASLPARLSLPGDRLAPAPAPGEARRWLVAGAALVAGCLLNPYGPGVLRYVVENPATSTALGIQEWLPPRLDTSLGIRFWGLLGLTSAVALARWRAVRTSDLLVFGVLALLAARSQRMIAWWALATAPLVVRWLAHPRAIASLASSPTSPAGATPPDPPSRLHVVLGRGLLVFWLVLLGLSVPSAGLDERGVWTGWDRDTPVAVTRWLEERPPANRPDGKPPETLIFCPFDWSSWISWRLFPAVRPLVDLHVWLYPPDLWDACLRAGRGEPGWQDLMDRYGIDLLVLDRRTQAGLVDAAALDPGWRRLYEDGQAVVFGR